MKRIAFFLFLFACLFNTFLAAQKFELGLSVGAGNPSVEWVKNSYYSRGEYTFSSRINAGAEICSMSASGFGGRAGLLYLARTANSDSVAVFPSRPSEYHSVVEANISTLFIPLQACYRLPFGKFYAQVSAGILPGFILNAGVEEKLIIRTNFPDIDEPARTDYPKKFEIGFIGEFRLAWQVAPKLAIGVNAGYFQSEVDTEITPDGSARNFVSQTSKGLMYGLSAHWAL